jgi:hypothetical protein
MKRAGSVLCPVMVGRDELLELVDHLISETAQRRGHVLFLSGQAGLGKTRLIRAAIRKAQAAGLRVDGGAVAPQDHQVPLASIREMANGMRGNVAFGTLSDSSFGPRRTGSSRPSIGPRCSSSTTFTGPTS